MSTLMFSSLGGLVVLIAFLLILVTIAHIFSSKKDDGDGVTGRINKVSEGTFSNSSTLTKIIGVIVVYAIFCLLFWALLPGEWQAWSSTRRTFLISSHIVIILLLILHIVIKKKDKGGKVGNTGWVWMVSLVLLIMLVYSASQELGDNKSSTFEGSATQQSVVRVASTAPTEPDWTDWIPVDYVPVPPKRSCFILDGVRFQIRFHTGREPKPDVSKGQYLKEPSGMYSHIRFQSTGKTPLSICRDLPSWKYRVVL